jgi:hypothetical protein
MPLVPEPPSQAPKQLTDGGRGSQKLLNDAPEEVVNTAKETRFYGDENGNVKDLSTGRGNQNTVDKSQKRVELPSKEEPYLDSKLLEMESSSQPQTNAHYRGKHGAQTTSEQQYNRATQGIDPISGVQETLPNGNPKTQNSTRFLSARDQMRAINRAKNILDQQLKLGKTNEQAIIEAEKPIQFDRVIGEGYQKNTGMYSTSKSAKVYFDRNTLEVKTAFPLWNR